MSARASTSVTRFAPVAVLAITLIVFAGAVAYVTLDLRAGLRTQILRREAETLNEVASLQLATETEMLGELGIKDAPGELLNAVLRASTKIGGVFAVRVFDAERHFGGALPLAWSERPPNARDWSQLASGTPVAHVHTRQEAATELIGLVLPVGNHQSGDPLVDVWVPLRTAGDAPLAGMAQFWIDGRELAFEFASVDRQLLTQSLMAFVAGAVIITSLLGWAFWRLADANRQLRSRGEDLLRANRELTLAAKTSALGTVAAHLMHELKNPVAGLEEFVSAQSELAVRGTNTGEYTAAFELTQRLRTMINDIVAVMRDEDSGGHFNLTCGEIVELAMAKVRPLAAKRGIGLCDETVANESLPARRANLIVLVLRNLLQNAVEASPAGGTVRVGSAPSPRGVELIVNDQGSGLPKSIRERLFQPCTSTKRGGSGLGLALSQQLARQAGGKIELVATGHSGTSFRVALDLGR